MRIEVLRRLGEGRAVHVGDEAEGEPLIAVTVERAIGHLRSEMRAADADVDDVPDPLSRVALPGARADLIGEGGHLVEHGVDLGNDVLAVDDDFPVARRPERDVQDGAVLAHVDLLAREHRVALRLHAAGAGEGREQTDGLVGDAVLRIVEEEPGRLDREALGSVRALRRTGR